VDAIRQHLADPLVTVDCRDGLDLSSVPSQGTVVLSDVEELPLEDQQRLNAWLAAADHRPRVISTSRASLFPMIEAGMFVDSLYYRLNVVCVDATKIGGSNP
jgi:DNA-binding NtrC family response regulator